MISFFKLFKASEELPQLTKTPKRSHSAPNRPSRHSKSRAGQELAAQFPKQQLRNVKVGGLQDHKKRCHWNPVETIVIHFFVFCVLWATFVGSMLVSMLVSQWFHRVVLALLEANLSDSSGAWMADVKDATKDIDIQLVFNNAGFIVTGGASAPRAFIFEVSLSNMPWRRTWPTSTATSLRTSTSRTTSTAT